MSGAFAKDVQPLNMPLQFIYESNDVIIRSGIDVSDVQSLNIFMQPPISTYVAEMPGPVASDAQPVNMFL